jgi:type IV secretion system protein VirB6
VFFGDIDMVNHPDNIKEACSGVDSIFCVTYDAVGKDPCSANFGQINGALTTQLNLGPFGKFTILTPAAVFAYFDPMMRLMLFAFLFYLFIGSVSGFLAVLTGVQDLSGMAKGSINAFNALASIGKKGASALSSKKK